MRKRSAGPSSSTHKYCGLGLGSDNIRRMTKGPGPAAIETVEFAIGVLAIDSVGVALAVAGLNSVPLGVGLALTVAL